jgi:hypothetical protein
MARPHLVQSLALEIQSASHGLLMGFPEYRAALSKLNASNNPELKKIHEALREAFK